MKKTFFALLATVFVMSICVGAADAAWITSFTTAKKVLLNTNATTLASQSAAGDIAYACGAGESLETNDTITITLSGGAKFSATAPALIQQSGEAGVRVAPAIVGSCTGLTECNFKVNARGYVGDVIILNSGSATIWNVSGVNSVVDVTMKATQTSAGGLTIWNKALSTMVGGFLAFSAPSASESIYYSAKTDTADVAATTGAYKKFTTASLTGTSVPFAFTNLAETANTAPNGIEVSATKVVFGFQGDLTGIASIKDSTLAGVIKGCDGTTGSQTGGATDTFLLSGTTAAYASNVAAVPPQGTVNANAQFTLNGTTSQTARGFNAVVNVLVDGTKWSAHAALAPTVIYTIARNGSYFSSNSIGAINTIKITDRSGGLGSTLAAITVTAWAADGTLIPESSTAPALTVANNGTTSISGTDLAARFPSGTSGPPMKYEFVVNSSNILVTSVKTNSDGSKSSTVYTSGTGAI
jgi:hypothetical protein